MSLLASFVAVFLTGLASDQLDLNQFEVHWQIGYVMTGLALLHVGVHWRYFTRAARGFLPRSKGSKAGPIESQELRPAEGAVDAKPPAQSISQPTAVRRQRLPRRTAIGVVGAGLVGTAAGWTAGSELSPNPYNGGDVGEFYHRESSLGVRALISNLLDWGRSPGRYKADDDGSLTALPPVERPPQMSVAQAFAQRRSLRHYEDEPMSAEDLAWLVQAATGITSADGNRSAPSAGALYPIETYAAVSRVEGIEPGLYHVDVRASALREVRSGSVAGDLMVAGLGQSFLRDAPVVLVLTGVFQRTRWKYHQRHYRYVCWEGGHISQNVYLAAEAAGLGACMVGAFLDGRVNDLLRVDGRQEAALGLIAIGPR